MGRAVVRLSPHWWNGPLASSSSCTWPGTVVLRICAITFSAALGKPAEALIHEAERHEAQMIVVGNLRMRGIGRVLGSVANSIAHNAPCDVYIVRQTNPERCPGVPCGPCGTKVAAHNGRMRAVLRGVHKSDHGA